MSLSNERQAAEEPATLRDMLPATYQREPAAPYFLNSLSLNSLESKRLGLETRIRGSEFGRTPTHRPTRRLKGGMERERADLYDEIVSDRRVTQRDPLGAVDGQNRYTYVRSSPLSGADPLGLVRAIGSFPSPWSADKVNEMIGELKKEFANPANLCVAINYSSRLPRFPYISWCGSCRLCPSKDVDFLKLLDAHDVTVALDAAGEITNPNRDAQAELGGHVILLAKPLFEGGGPSEPKVKDLLVHELVHIAGFRHGARPFAWVEYSEFGGGENTGWGEGNKDEACRTAGEP